MWLEEGTGMAEREGGKESVGLLGKRELKFYGGHV